jgi:predicted nucleic acid-binding protein
MKKDLIAYPGVVVDTGVWIEYFLETTLGKKFKERIVEDQISIYISETVVSEIFYVLCRQKGIKEAKKKIDMVLDGAEVIEGREIQMIAGKYKCERAISLSDCFTMAVSKRTGFPALFKEEEEIRQEISKKAFDVELFFLEDI